MCVKRVFHPSDQNTGKDAILPTLIPEEAEKLQQRVPSWKLELVAESLPYMITDEDPGTKTKIREVVPATNKIQKPVRCPRPKFVEA